jgi:hypothetical protein
MLDSCCLQIINTMRRPLGGSIEEPDFGEEGEIKGGGSRGSLRFLL